MVELSHITSETEPIEVAKPPSLTLDVPPEDQLTGQEADIIVTLTDRRDSKQGPYTIDIDTSELNLEYNQVFVKAYDTAGNDSERQDIWIFLEKSEFVYLPILFR